MAYVWQHPKSKFWTAVYRNDQNVWTKKTTKKTAKTTALALAIEWERSSQLGRDRILTESLSREIIGGILERTTGESLRQVTLREFMAEWLRGKTHSRQEGTAARYLTTVGRFTKSMDAKADAPIAAITTRDCQKFYDDLMAQDLAPATMRCEMKIVAGVFNLARQQGLISTNPASAIELPGRIKQVKRMTFTSAQVQMLLDAADDEWKTAILLGYYCGLRLGDAAALTWASVDLAGSKLVIEVHKTGETLEVPMHPTLEGHLSKLAGDTGGPVCPALAAGHVSGRAGLSRKFITLMRSAGIGTESVGSGGKRFLARLSFHALRTSFNSALFNKGVDQELRRKLTGHKSDAVNDRYTRPQMDTLREAVNLLPSLKA